MLDEMKLTQVGMQIRGEWSSGLRHFNHNLKFPCSNDTSCQAGLVTQPRCEVPDDVQVKYVKVLINIE